MILIIYIYLVILAGISSNSNSTNLCFNYNSSNKCYPDIPCGIVINPVLLIDKSCETLFREIPNEDELYPVFHPPFDVVKKQI